MNKTSGIAKLKTSRQIEKHLKGVANHYRIEILFLIAEQPGVVFEDIVKIVGANEKTLGEHVRRLFQAGLVNKKHRGRFVEHSLSPYGKMFMRFLKSFQSVQ